MQRASLLKGIAAAALGLFLVACGQAFPTDNNADQGSVIVQVNDQTGAGVPSASVWVELAEGNENRGTGTQGGALGQVEIDNISAGSHLIWVSPPTGYTGGGEGNGSTVTVPNGASINLTLTLVKTAP